jgi:hypothetical protein
VYGLTPVEYDKMVEEQNGKCAICGKDRNVTSDKRRLAVDHDHETGQVRGLLCTICNTRLGILENAEWVQKARAYLDSSRSAKT